MHSSHMSYSGNRSLERAALTVTCLTSFLSPFMGASVNVALPQMGEALGLGAVMLGWINMSFLLLSASLAVPFGRLGDLFGRKRFFTAGIIVFTLSSAFIASASSGTGVIIGRAVQGIGSAMLVATSTAILISVFPPEKRGRVLGINVSSVYLGLSSGPFIGGIITEFLGWRALFMIHLPFGIVLVGIVLVMLKGEWVENHSERFDTLGAVILSLSLLAILYSFSKLPSLTAISLLVLGTMGLVVFSIVELRTNSPLIDVRIFFNNRVFALSNMAALINYASTFAVTFLISIYLQKIRGMTPNEAGLMLVCQPLMQTLLSPLAGRMSDKIEPRYTATAGMVLCAIGLALLTFLNEATSKVFLIGCLLFLGLGFAAFSSPNTKAVMSSVDRKMFGVAGAVLGTMRQTGMSLSMGIVMIILTVQLGQSEVSVSNAASFIFGMKSAFALFAGLCIVGAAASLARGGDKSLQKNAS